ncbi:phospholipid phosphatase 2-like isoform X1 [Pararge aegeria]|uniref:phospholipid phosphatase 2-like isoform X1 n=1 Tax=Pararge aegeria TaxID=116150 RepID=UPI0019D1AE21|nr:phospholipid phosphatase 2-like isoform X1 [Pararge aegeria]
MGALDCVSKSKIAPTVSTEVFTVNMSSQSSLNEPRKDVESQLITEQKGQTTKRLWWFLGVDIPLLVTVLLLIGLFEYGVIPHYKNGFFCNDPALSFPFKGDTVSMEVIVSTILLLPFALIFITEIILFDSTYTMRTKLNYVSRKTAILYRNYIYGLFFNLMTVEVMKGITGNPRPTFFDICEPDTLKTCNGSEYVSTFQCTSTRFAKWYQTDSYHSFPSGHTSLSVYCGLFMAWYLQQRAFNWRHRTVFLVPLAQLLCITYTAVCSLTRITDHRHHWWDVLVGAGIGVITLLFTVLVICDNFKRRPQILKGNPMTDSQHTVRTLVFDGPQQSSDHSQPS